MPVSELGQSNGEQEKKQGVVRRALEKEGMQGPDRMNQQFERFKKTQREIIAKLGKLSSLFIPEEVKEKFDENISSLATQFGKYLNQAVRDYGTNRDKGIKDRDKAEENLEKINGQLQKMNEDLDRWEHISKKYERIDVIKQEIKNIINNVKDEKVLKEKRENLIRWDKIQKAQIELEKVLDDHMPDECRHLARNLADKEFVMAEYYYYLLGQKSLEMLANSLEARPARLKKTLECHKYMQEKCSAETKEWKKHVRSCELMLACFGNEYLFDVIPGRADKLKLYVNYMNSCVDEICQSLNKENHEEASQLIESFIDRKKEFEAYLKEQGWLGNTRLEMFQRAFKTEIKEKDGIFEINSEDKYGGGNYINKINVNEGQIIGVYNYKERTRGWAFSEVVYAQLQLVLKKAGKDLSQFDLKSWYGQNVINERTEAVAKSFLSQGETERTFKAGSAEFATLAKSPTAKSKFYLLAQHSGEFGRKEVTSITVKRIFERKGEKLADGEIEIDYAIGEGSIYYERKHQ